MKTITYLFDNKEAFDAYCKSHKLHDNNQLLIQVFVGIISRKIIADMQRLLHERFPHAAIIGTTTDGAINQGKMIDEEAILLGFTQFEHTQLKVDMLEYSGTDYFHFGHKLAQSLVTEDTRAVICFADGLHTNGEDLLNGFNQHSPDVPIAGGMAGDNAQMINTFVFTATECTENGAVAVALNNPELIVNTHSSFNWLPIGKHMKVTRSVKNRVYEIDGEPAYNIYAKYLGSDIARRLPVTGIKFPLIAVRNGIEIGRAVIDSKPDGSLLFAGNIIEGEYVRFGVGNSELILRDGARNAAALTQVPVENTFVYSCMARRHFMGKTVESELQPLDELAPTVGFFTYGEFFYTNGETQLLNQSMTQISLSELPDVQQDKAPVKVSLRSLENDKHTDTLQALGFLTNAVSRELESLNNELEKRVKDKTEEILKHIYTDSLTQLPNREKLIHDLTYKEHSYVILINIDDFSSLNDFFGHIIGDFILKYLADVIYAHIDKSQAELYKLSGDEYAVLYYGIHSSEDMESFISDLSGILRHLSIDYHGQVIQVSATIGAAMTLKGAKGLHKADLALKQAKKNNSVNFILYDDSMKLSENIKENLDMAIAVCEAIKDRHIVPYYQPLYDVKSGEIVKYECLARMIKKEGTVVWPGQFLPAAEKIRVYPEITHLMVEQALECHARTGWSLSLNISINDIHNADTRDYLLEQLSQLDENHGLTFEILETEEVINDSVVSTFIREVQSLGGQIAIDDFGSGFANFQYMIQINADIIKIDGSLIRNLHEDKNAFAVVETIVTFARRMGMTTVAEFVHSAEVLKAVREIGIDWAQGFYLSEPIKCLE